LGIDGDQGSGLGQEKGMQCMAVFLNEWPFYPI
jgi:hypothetical protein